MNLNEHPPRVRVGLKGIEMHIVSFGEENLQFWYHLMIFLSIKVSFRFDSMLCR